MMSRKVGFYGIFALIFFCIACNSNTETKPTETPEAKPAAAAIPIVDFSAIEKILNQQDDTLRIFNFWATWCKPCVEELPLLQELPAKYNNQAFQLYYISLDFTNQIESKLIPFLQNNPLDGSVIVLDDPDANSWIDKVNPEWSGSIPATIVKKGMAMKFHEGKFNTFSDIQNLISQL